MEFGGDLNKAQASAQCFAASRASRAAIARACLLRKPSLIGLLLSLYMHETADQAASVAFCSVHAKRGEEPAGREV